MQHASCSTVDVMYARMVAATGGMGKAPLDDTNSIPGGTTNLTPMMQSKLHAYTCQLHEELTAKTRKAVQEEAKRCGTSLEGAAVPVRTLMVTPVLQVCHPAKAQILWQIHEHLHSHRVLVGHFQLQGGFCTP